ncbi:flavin reductase family protein [Fictibacillus terranigra]|uniref:Flavin reductase family protein n=1 Tax=Fictibacillus terranigra TaxID=3058424 RepID=A0ABT8E204_9BACL|nr:flavin reductase family protein [Fictibacillus sp. CENA-BCM004]MDN4071920.1 flavin reductase family protein [Fictibacillus sp. CENA-BCM004]
MKEIQTITPKILYYGTPVILLTTLNDDHTTNISPISSSWALGNSIILGIGLGGKAIENLESTPECVLNIPDALLWEKVEKLAPYTAKDPVPYEKQMLGFTCKKDKFTESGFTSTPSVSVQPDRIQECPLQIEAKVEQIRVPDYSPFFAIVETQAVNVHAHPEIITGTNHIDPAQWRPLIYNFRHYFGLGEELGKTYRSET